MATDYLQKCCDLHTELTEIRFSRRQDLGDIERAVAHVRSSRQLTYDDIEKIRDSRVGMPICSATGQAVRKSSRFSIPRNGTSGTSRSVRTRRLRPSNPRSRPRSVPEPACQVAAAGPSPSPDTRRIGFGPPHRRLVAAIPPSPMRCPQKLHCEITETTARPTIPAFRARV